MTTKLLPAILTKKEITTVDVKFIPYVESLWNRLVASRISISTKKEYLEIVRQLNVKSESVKQVEQHYSEETSEARKAVGALERIKKLLAAGAEPNEPNFQWYVGVIQKPRPKTTLRLRQIYPVENWRGQSVSSWSSRDNGYRQAVYTGPMPVHALQALASLGPLVDDYRIYSPDAKHFAALPEPISRVNIDPVLSGRIEYLGQNEYFELARWDIDRDLAGVFSKGGKAAVPEVPVVDGKVIAEQALEALENKRREWYKEQHQRLLASKEARRLTSSTDEEFYDH